MKTMKELQERGTNYLCGYTDALVDLAYLLINDTDHPMLYDPSHTQEILKVVNEYVTGLLQEGCEKHVTK